MVGSRREKLMLMVLLGPLYWLRHNLDVVPCILAGSVLIVLVAALVAPTNP